MISVVIVAPCFPKLIHIVACISKTDFCEVQFGAYLLFIKPSVCSHLVPLIFGYD